MPSSNSFISLALFSGLIPSVLLFGTALFLIALDLRRRRWEHKHARRSVWYQRLWLFLAAAEILWGLKVLMQVDIIALLVPYPLFAALTILLNMLLFVFLIALFLSIIVHEKNKIFLLPTIILRSITSGRDTASMQEVLREEQHFSGVLSKEMHLEMADTRSILGAGIIALISFSFLLGLVQLVKYPLRDLPGLYGWALLFTGITLAGCLILVARANGRLYAMEAIKHHNSMFVSEKNLAILDTERVFPPTLAITFHIKRNHLGLWLVIVLGFMSLPLTPFLNAHSALTIDFLMSLWFGGFFLLKVLFSLSDGRSIYITDDGIKTEKRESATRRIRYIVWPEAQSFTCYRLPSFFLGRKTIVYYELSSPNVVVTWMWVLDPQSPLTLWKPSLPIDEYHCQMQALCALVEMKTGLTLHDLSQPIDIE